jgi:hypothetical protein
MADHLFDVRFQEDFHNFPHQFVPDVCKIGQLRVSWDGMPDHFIAREINHIFMKPGYLF